MTYKHRLSILIIVLILAAPFYSCRQASDASTENYVNKPKQVDLSSNQSNPLSNSSRTNSTYDSDTAQIPRVQLPTNFSTVQLVDVNLDLDRHEEQVLIAQDNNSELKNIRLFIADYDEIRDRYIITWDSETQAQQRKGLQVTVLDATGDHNLEIICSGLNTDGHQTIDIFRRTTSPGEYGLFFNSILSLHIKGTIELQETKRTQSYQNGLTNGTSFPVITNTKDVESERISDIIKRTYIWRNDSRRYELVLEKKVSGTDIEDLRLKELFESGSEAFEEFFHGPWLFTRSDQNPAVGGAQSLINFDSKEKTITFYSGDVQEIYTWTSSHRFLSNSLAIWGENEIVPFIRIYISAYVQDLNHIRLIIYDIDSHNGQRSTNTSWTGVYQKIGESLKRSFLPSSLAEQNAQSGLPSLTGIYRSDEGNEIYFDPPLFTLTRQDESLQGGFSVYNMGSDILELKVLDVHGIPVERLCYSFDYYEEKKSTEITRRLFLLPGIIGVHGFEPSSKQPIRFEQVEQIEEQTDKDTNTGNQDSLLTD